MSYLNQLPEDVSRLVWKKVFDGVVQTIKEKGIFDIHSMVFNVTGNYAYREYNNTISQFVPEMAKKRVVKELEAIQGDNRTVKVGDILQFGRYNLSFFRIVKETPKRYRIQSISRFDTFTPIYRDITYIETKLIKKSDVGMSSSCGYRKWTPRQVEETYFY